ncbi:hypothetical protein [Streptomyces regalis]|uniref:Alkyl hydroperoxide reductase n=1 Tax=Streptomyces regalis TaxID=68262 RepID=A0A0X3USA8_9ACTN|nr:hypothetical protein [Streptomyces regalis]KUL35469.1 hypothetical protein ADL12_20030 [Streptomyces regalis]
MPETHKPRRLVPPLEVELVGGGRWSLAEQRPARFTCVFFYCGQHYPDCGSYLRQLDGLLDELARVGVTSVIAASGDDEEHAGRSVRECGLECLPVGYGQSVASMREWARFVSRAVKDGEPEPLGEPGFFLVRSDGTLYAAALITMPLRPSHPVSPSSLAARLWGDF